VGPAAVRLGSGGGTNGQVKERRWQSLLQVGDEHLSDGPGRIIRRALAAPDRKRVHDLAAIEDLRDLVDHQPFVQGIRQGRALMCVIVRPITGARGPIRGLEDEEPPRGRSVIGGG
jgi:hypothetical protein